MIPLLHALLHPGPRSFASCNHDISIIPQAIRSVDINQYFLKH